MTRRLAIIALGYAVAVSFGLAGVVLNELAMPPEVSNASSGMAAFGDLVLFVGMAGLAGLIPTWWLVRLVLRR